MGLQSHIETNKNQYRWSFRKKGKDVLKLCRQLTVVLSLTTGLVLASGDAQANPTGGNVTAGSATISSSGNTTTINQSSQRAIIEWKNFDIAAGETTRFVQPNSNALALNRVVNSSQATSINGNLLANGRVLVINPNGVLIGPSGNVDVAGFVASTADIDNTRFMSATGAMEFDRAGKIDAAVENQGRITIRDAGLGLLVGPTVRNSGVIEGNMAKLQLGAGDTFGVDLYGDGLLHLAVGAGSDKRTISAENAGTIVADAGKVVMTAAAASNVVNSVINTSGVIEAKGLTTKGGKIVLTGAGADIQVAGKIDASGKTGGGEIKIGGDVQGGGTLAKAKTVDVQAGSEIKADAVTTGDGGTIAVWSDVLTTTAGSYSAKGGAQSGNGGFVETSSKLVLETAGTSVDTSAAKGNYGLWLLDPTNYFINSGNVASINNAASNVQIIGDYTVFVNSNINMVNAGVGLTIQTISGDITIDGKSITLNGGDLNLKAGGSGTLMVSNGSTVRTNGGDVIFDAGTLRMGGANIDTAGGDYNLDAVTGDITNGTFRTGGGAFDFRSTGSTAFTSNNLSTAGGDVSIVALGSMTLNDTKINTTGGSTPAAISLTTNGAPATFSQISNNGTLQQTENSGDVRISAAGAAWGPQLCVSAGGSTCGVVTQPANVTYTISIKGVDTFKTYGALDPVFNFTITSGALQAGDSWTGALTRAAGNGVGTYAINRGTLNATTSGSYTYVIDYTPGVFTINPAFLTITAINQGKTYGDALSLGTTAFSQSGLLAGDSITGVTLASAGAAATANAGNHAITASGAVGTGLANYSITYNNGTLSVAKAPLTMTAVSGSKVYGTVWGGPSGAVATFSGFKNGDNVTSNLGISYSGGVAAAAVGTYAITPFLSPGHSILNNYTVTYVNGALNVTPAALTITANARTKTYGDLLTLGTTAFGVSGLKNSDSVTGVTLASAGAAQTATRGTYAITAADAVGTGLSNYTIAYNNGQLVVNPAALTITANARTKTYGDLLTLGTTAFGVVGLKNSDSVTGVTLASAGAAQTAAVGNYAITAADAVGTGLSNYTITYNSGSLNVGRASLVIKANDRTKTYGDLLTLGNSAFTATGLKNSDSVSAVTLASPGRFAIAPVGDYNITASGASGSGLSNYNVSYQTGTLKINPAQLTVTARDQTKIYGDYRDVDGALLPFLVSGLKNLDYVSDVSLSSAGGAATASVGDYAIAAANATGFGLSNYTINYVNGNLNVLPAALLITADTFSKTYGGTHIFDSSDYSVYGLKNSDTVTSVDLTSAGAAATANVGLYGIFGSNAAGAGLTNYAIVYVPGLMLVNPALLTITAQDQGKTYGTALDLGTTAFDVTGLKNSDTVNGATLASAGAAGTANVGTYGITASNATGSGLSNYTISYVDGVLNVGKAALTLTANNAAKTYGSALAFNGTEYTLGGTLYNGDTVNGATLASAGAAGTANVGTYGITASNATGSGLTNYDISYVDGVLNVGKAALTVVANNQIKRFGSDFVFNGTEFGTVGTLYNGDTVDTATLTSPGAAANASELFSPYVIYVSNAAGTGLANYDVTYVNGFMVVNPPPAVPGIVFENLNRPIVSVANNVLVRDTPFEAIEVRTLDTDVALRYRSGGTASSTPNPAAALAALEPAAGGEMSAEDLAALEPAAGGDDTPTADELASLEPAAGGDVACANNFLDNLPCDTQE